MGSPFRGALHADQLDAMRIEQIDRRGTTGRGVVEDFVAGFDAVGVDDPDGEGVPLWGRSPRPQTSCCAPAGSRAPVGPRTAGALRHN